jgi:hypothetical protein
MPVPQYLIDNRQNITNYNQNYNGWFNGYQNYRVQYPIINNVYDQFNSNDNPLSRAAIKQLYANANNDEDLFFAFICTMVWGQRGLVGDGGVERFFDSYLRYSEDISQKLNSIKINFDLIYSFNLLNNIERLGPSYSTKVIYFMKYDNFFLKPLIFDKKQLKLYFKLLQLGQFTTKLDRIFNNDIRNCTLTKLRKSTNYLDYIIDMNDWAKNIHVEPDSLEAWTFDNYDTIMGLNR